MYECADFEQALLGIVMMIHAVSSRACPRHERRLEATFVFFPHAFGCLYFVGLPGDIFFIFALEVAFHWAMRLP